MEWFVNFSVMVAMLLVRECIIAGHEPGALTRTAADITNVISGNGVAGADYRYQLNDTAGAPFPGVWIQERFVPNDPPEQGFRTNKLSGKFWTTRMKDGYFDGVDEFLYNWPFDHNDRHWVHHYWAATKDFTTGGIDMGATLSIFSMARLRPLLRIPKEEPS